VSAQGLPQVLINLLVSFVPSTYDNEVPAAATGRGYVDIGLAQFSGIELQSITLGAVMQLLEQPKDFQYLGRHAIAVCLPPFVQFVESDMQRFGERCPPDLINNTLDLSPYLNMLGKRSPTLPSLQ